MSAGVLSATPRHVLVDALDQARQHLAGAAFDQRVDTLRLHVLHALAPAHQAGHLLHQPLLIASGSVTSAASTLATSGTRGVGQRHGLQRLPHRVGGGLHQRAMERRADRQQHAALAPLRLGHLDGPLDGRLVAGNHDLAAAIVVGDRDDLALRRFLAGLLRRLELDAEQRRHGAHARPAPPSASPGRAASEAARCRRAAGRRPPPAPSIRRANGRRHGWPALASGLPPSFSRTRTHGHADGHQGRLGVFGQDQLGFRPFAHQLRQVLLQRLVDFLEDLAGGGEGSGEVGSHADGLGALSRKDESATHGPISPCSWPEAALSYPTQGAGRNALISGDLPV